MLDDCEVEGEKQIEFGTTSAHITRDFSNVTPLCVKSSQCKTSICY